MNLAKKMSTSSTKNTGRGLSLVPNIPKGEKDWQDYALSCSQATFTIEDENYMEVIAYTIKGETDKSSEVKKEKAFLSALELVKNLPNEEQFIFTTASFEISKSEFLIRHIFRSLFNDKANDLCLKDRLTEAAYHLKHILALKEEIQYMSFNDHIMDNIAKAADAIHMNIETMEIVETLEFKKAHKEYMGVRGNPFMGSHFLEKAIKFIAASQNAHSLTGEV